MEKYANELKEVYVILNTLVEEDYNKIPKITLQAIEKNMNKDYEYKIDEDIDLRDFPILPGTKEILFNIFRDYLATENQRRKIKRMQAEDRLKLEKQKQTQYNIDVFGYNEKKTSSKLNEENQKNLKEQTNENMQLIKYKENIFTKIIKAIKNIFKRR